MRMTLKCKHPPFCKKEVKKATQCKGMRFFECYCQYKYKYVSKIKSNYH